MSILISGMDYTTSGLRPGQGISNLRFAAIRDTPNNPFTVEIINDDEPEPLEVIDIFLECSPELTNDGVIQGENCLRSSK